MIHSMRLQPFFQTNGGASGIKRGGGGGKTEQTQTASVVQTIETRENVTLNASDPKAIEQLREMASRGEVPEFIDGTNIDKEKFFEEFNRLYPDPPGILNDYRIDTSMGRNQVGIFYNYNMALAESPQFMYLSRGRHTSEEGRAGQIKHAIYVTRSNVEYALSSRRGGFSDIGLALKYGGRVVSKAEHDEANRIIISQVEKLMGSPMTKRGLRMNESDWEKRDGGYFRIGTERFTLQNGEL